RLLRAILQYDRVMIYQFAPDGSGTVIAEAKAPDLEPYLGLHYPDSDIPRQAKYLYTLNPLRLIPEVNYEPVPILSQESESKEPLDLSFSTLRSVSPIHIEYLKNMGVGASMSISLLKQGVLWGLIACHHKTPKGVSYTLRSVCEFLGQVMSLELISKEEKEGLDDKVQLRTIQAQFVEAISTADNLVDALLDNRDNLLGVVGATGAALCISGHLTLVGKTPSESEVYELLDWLQDRFQDNLFVTDSLTSQYPQGIDFREVGSGLLALSISKIQKDAVLWFRPEILQQVNWAGNPDKPKRVEVDGSLTIFPRKSFSLWQETVRLKSLPWQSWEVGGAMELRSAIVGIVLKRADELAALNLELERTNIELDAFAYIASHDLKEPLRGIHNYSTFLLEDYALVLDQEGVDKLETLVNLTKRMEDLINSLLHFSRLGRQELHLYPIDFNRLVDNVKGILQMSLPDLDMEIRVPRTLPTVQGDRVLMEEVLANLISNGLKYNDNPQKWVEVGFQEPRIVDGANPIPVWTFYVRDNGIGIRDKHLDNIFRIFKRLHAPGKYGGGTGAGLTIVKKIIERHGGRIWVESIYGKGSTFYFTLPA
ncbi:MAG: ATP-binding protein, partial [Leptolyngbyaceae cyanobacterium bins.59]|nr:ATP-binding protein [Leptolyngbyaceae cyanobacterium bins.59]